GGGGARGGRAAARLVALVGRGASAGVAPRAGAALAVVGLGAGIAVVAGGAVRRGRVRAHAGLGVAGADHMALILSAADDRVRSDAGAAQAGAALRAEVAVLAGGQGGEVGGGGAGGGNAALGG